MNERKLNGLRWRPTHYLMAVIRNIKVGKVFEKKEDAEETLRMCKAIIDSRVACPPSFYPHT